MVGVRASSRFFAGCRGVDFPERGAGGGGGGTEGGPMGWGAYSGCMPAWWLQPNSAAAGWVVKCVGNC